MGKLIKAIARAERRAAGMPDDEGPQSLSSDVTQEHPRNFEFYRVLHDFDPATLNGVGRRGTTLSSLDLVVKKGDFVAVLSKSDPMGNPSEWWRCRTRDDRTGYLPGPYLAKIQLRPNVAISPPNVARASSSSIGPPGATTSDAPARSATEPTPTPASAPTSQSSNLPSVSLNPVRPYPQLYTNPTNTTGQNLSAAAAAPTNPSISIAGNGTGVNIAGKSSDISAENFLNSPFSLPRIDPARSDPSRADPSRVIPSFTLPPSPSFPFSNHPRSRS